MTSTTSSDSSDRLARIENKLDTLSDRVEQSNYKFDTYQKSTQWVVQLAFTLIASATITVIISTVVK